MDKATENELLKTVRRNYEEIADSFSETRRKKLWPELSRLAKSIKEGESVLDAGCGNGRLVEAFDDKKIRYLGVDTCKRLVHNAQTLRLGYKFREGNVLNLGAFNELNFDHVFCVATLQHIPGRRLQVDVMRQLRNKVRPGGRIVLSVWNMWGQPRFRRMVFRFWLLKLLGKNRMDFGDVVFDWKGSRDKKPSRRYYHVFRKKELKNIALKAGLHIVHAYKDKYNYYLILTK